MSNSKTPTNAFSPTNQPTPGNTRGKSPKTKSLAAVKRVMGWSEEELYDYMVEQALKNNDDEMLDRLMKAAIPTPRTTLPSVTFQYDRSLPYHEKCEVILEAVSQGDLEPDVGLDIISSIKNIALIKEQTEIEKRIEALEDLLKKALNL
jgi:hypothetical protein